MISEKPLIANISLSCRVVSSWAGSEFDEEIITSEADAASDEDTIREKE